MPGRKRVHLLRHGQSAFNVTFDESSEDPGIIDAPLTLLGREQARAAAAQVRQLQVDLIVTSPARRALETTCALLSEGSYPPVVVDPTLRERINDPSDLGTLTSELSRDFPMFDFAHVDELWWRPGELDHRGVPVETHEELWVRLGLLRRWLLERPEQSILLVGHWGFFRDIAGLALDNGQLAEWLTFPFPAPNSFRPLYPMDRPQWHTV